MRQVRVGVLSVLMVMMARVPDAAPSNGTITGTVRFLRDGQETSFTDGYVYLVPAPRRRASRPPKPVTATIVLEHRRFTPNRGVAPVGSTIVFPNREARSKPANDHHVFSPTQPTPFDLGRYGSGASKSRKFLDEGEFDIYCDIHKDENAKVKVVDSDRIVPVVNGTFTLTDVPPGNYKVVAWAADSAESRETIMVAAGEAARVPQLTVDLGRPKPLIRKDGRAYHR